MMDAQYTIVLKTLLDNPEAKARIDKALSTYPMYTPINKYVYGLIPTREELNEKLLNHYKYREIGFETPGRFIDELEIAMNEIMPYYYQRYKTLDVINGIDDIFGNVNITETFLQETSGSRQDNFKGDNKETSSSNASNTSSSDVSSESSTESDVSNKGRTVKSDTPQSQLKASVIDSITSASEMGWNEDSSHSKATTSGKDTTNSNSSSESGSESNSESSSETKHESSGTTKHTLHKEGNQGVNTYAHDMEEFRRILINIEQEIINDERIQELFMLVY